MQTWAADPSWVADTVGISNGAAIAIRACAEGEGDVLAVEIVNNRPYGMTLTYGVPVKWGWHEAGGSGVDAERNALADRMAKPGTLYLPPKSRASVGIPAFTPGKNVVFSIGISGESVVPDIAALLMPELLGKLTGSACKAFLAEAPFGGGTGAPGELLDLTRNVAQCLASSLAEAAAWGDLNWAAVGQIDSLAKALKKVNVVGRYWKVAGVEWTLSDLFVDWKVVGGAGSLGVGFSVRAKSTTTSRPPPGGGGTPPANWHACCFPQCQEPQGNGVILDGHIRTSG